MEEAEAGRRVAIRRGEPRARVWTLRRFPDLAGPMRGGHGSEERVEGLDDAGAGKGRHGFTRGVLTRPETVRPVMPAVSGLDTSARTLPASASAPPSEATTSERAGNGVARTMSSPVRTASAGAVVLT